MITWAYIAGFMDGEGTVEMRNRRVVLFQSTSTVLMSIKQFLESEGLVTSFHKRQDRTHNNLGYILCQYQLVVSHKPSVSKFLWGVRPYTIVKKQRVEDLWRYLRMFPVLSNHVTGGLAAITSRHVSRRNRT